MSLTNLIPADDLKRIGWHGLFGFVRALIRVNRNARRDGFKVKIEATFPMPWW